jgi:HlyD family secretion protein
VKVEAFPDRTFRGDVQKIEPQATVQQNVTMFPVIVSLDNRAGLLKPGMNAEVNILIAQALDVLLVPNSAIVRPQDVGPAALALGLDVESMDLTQFMRAGRNGNGGTRPGGAAVQGGGVAPAASPTPQGEGAPPQGAAGAGGTNPQRAQFDSLRAKVDRGEISQDSMRAIMASMRGGAVGAGGAGAAMGSQVAGAGPTRETRTSVVFIMGADSVPVPRLVEVGLNDWDNSQVVGGLQEGDVLVVVSAAQLQAQQTQWLAQMRSRMGGSPFGGGGMGGGRPPGR